MVGQLRKVPGLFEALSHLGLGGGEPAPVMASAAEFVLEGLYGQKKIGRSDDRGFTAPERHSDADLDLDKLERLRRMKKQVN
jgi:magnesium chelatase subunit I